MKTYENLKNFVFPVLHVLLLFVWFDFHLDTIDNALDTLGDDGLSQLGIQGHHGAAHGAVFHDFHHLSNLIQYSNIQQYTAIRTDLWIFPR